ncbi:MAG: glycogen synthase [Rhodothermales bacterium]
MRIAILTNEYPPNVYGGAGVHVEYLVKELTALDGGSHEVEVVCFGDQKEDRGNLRVTGVQPDADLPATDERHKKFLETMVRDVRMAGLVEGADIVHCHTWYSHFAGCLVRQLDDAKLVLTTHSLEPHRPWKVEQLGTAYHASSWIEKTAYQNADGVVAVSESMKRDVMELYGVADERVRVIPNGIDPDEYRPVERPDVLEKHGIDPSRPFVLFVGRITRQKGIVHLVNAIRQFDEGMQVVLCAGAPDTEEIEQEMERAVSKAREAGNHDIHWIADMLPRDEIIAIYAAAAVFVCPSVYEPFGIINLEAMACETAVVASAVGGIPSIVVEEETGLLVPFEAKGPVDFEPRVPEAFSSDLAQAVNRLMGDAALRSRMGKAGRQRVLERYSWRAIAEHTVGFYGELLDSDR